MVRVRRGRPSGPSDNGPAQRLLKFLVDCIAPADKCSTETRVKIAKGLIEQQERFIEQQKAESREKVKKALGKLKEENKDVTGGGE